MLTNPRYLVVHVTDQTDGERYPTLATLHDAASALTALWRITEPGHYRAVSVFNDGDDDGFEVVQTIAEHVNRPAPGRRLPR